MLITISTVSIMSCTNSSLKKTHASIDSFSHYIVDTISIPISQNSIAHNTIKALQVNGEEHIAYVQKTSRCLYFYSLDKAAITDSIALSQYNHSDVDDLHIKDHNTVYISYDDGNLFLLKKENLKWNAINNWDMNLVTNKIDSNSYFSVYQYRNGICIFGDTVVGSIYTKNYEKSLTVDTFFIKGHYDIIGKLQSNEVQLIDTINIYPKYFLQNDYHASRNRISINSHTLLYTFDHIDSIFVHDIYTKQTQTYKISSPFFTRRAPYDYSQMNESFYENNYHINNAEFSMVFHNPYSKQNYLFLKHDGTRIEEDNTENDYYDINMSLIIVDSSFKKSKELFIPGSTLELPHTFITEKYFYIPLHYKNQKDPSTMTFYKIKL